MMKTLISYLALGAFLLLFSGCLDVEESFTINPDKSGKVDFRYVKSIDSFSINIGGKTLEGDEKVRHALAEMIKQSEGVSAWSDVTVEETDDGEIAVSGTAYFDDVTSLKLNYGSFSRSSDELLWSVIGPGKLNLQIGKSENGDADPESSNTPTAEFSDEEIRREIEKQTKQMEKAWPILQTSLASMKSIKRFRFSGDVEANARFEKEGKSWVYKEIGTDTLSRIEAIKDDPAFLRKAAIRSLQIDGKANNDGFDEFIYGEPARLKVQFSSNPIFDYKASVQKANEQFPEMMTALGMERDIPGLLPPAEKEGFKKFVLGGVQRVKDLGLDFHARPLNTEPGLKLSFVGYFDGRILGFTEGRVESATDEHGQSLLSSNDWKRKINGPRLNEVNDIIVFDVDLTPAANSKKVAQLSGSIEYTVASETEKVDLGFEQIAPEAKGSIEGSEIKSVGKSKWNDNFEMQILLPMDRAVVKEIRAYTSEGKPFPLESSGSSWSSNQVTLTYNSAAEIPADLRLELERYTNVLKFKTSFAYDDIPIPQI